MKNSLVTASFTIATEFSKLWTNVHCAGGGIEPTIPVFQWPLGLAYPKLPLSQSSALRRAWKLNFIPSKTWRLMQVSGQLQAPDSLPVRQEAWWAPEPF